MVRELPTLRLEPMKAMNDRLRSQLASYHAAKLALQNELRTELDRLRALDRDLLAPDEAVAHRSEIVSRRQFFALVSCQ